MQTFRKYFKIPNYYNYKEPKKWQNLHANKLKKIEHVTTVKPVRRIYGKK